MWLKKLLDKLNKPLYNSRYNLGEKMASKNYTDEMVSVMVKQYEAEPTLDTVATLAQDFGKTTRSIIAKLSREGVYKAQPRTTKTGEPVVRKDELVAEIATMLGIDDSTIATVSKATKADLKNLVQRLSEIV
jgi:response regulator RpfG family c-di-GMP phosphodiesterase